jgi:hypothetical protein
MLEIMPQRYWIYFTVQNLFEVIHSYYAPVWEQAELLLCVT